MKHVRKMAMVVNQVKMEDEDNLDVLFWLNRTASERLSDLAVYEEIISPGQMAFFLKKLRKLFTKESYDF